MKRTAIAVSMCFGMVPSAAFALDWSLQNDPKRNRRTQQQPVSADLACRVPWILFDHYSQRRGANADFQIRFRCATALTKNIGDRASTACRRNTLNYGFKARYERDGKNKFDREFIESSWRQQSTSLALLNELGVAAAGERISRHADGQRWHRPLGDGARQSELVCDIDTHKLRTIKRRNAIH